MQVTTKKNSTKSADEHGCNHPHDRLRVKVWRLAPSYAKATRITVRTWWNRQPVGIRAAMITGGCIIVAALVTALVTVPLPSKRQPPPSPRDAENEAAGALESAPDDPEPAPILEMSFAEYLDTVAQVEDRFLERAEFNEGLVGARVRWEGVVESVSVSVADSRDLVLLIKYPKADRYGNAYFFFPESWRTKLFSLDRGDVVVVEGIIFGNNLTSIGAEGVSIDVKLDESAQEQD